MKRFTLFLTACFCFINGFAAYLRDVPTTVTQPDGTILHCFASGDEFFNYLHDKDGYTILQHPITGYYVYAENRAGKLVATNFIAGKHNPSSKGLQPYALISPEEWMARRKAWEEPERHHQNRDYVPNHGTLNNISIFIRFADDEEFVNTFSSIDSIFNYMSGSYGTSLRSYFQAASYGAIDIPTTFYPGHDGENVISYQDTCTRNYFQPYNATTNPNGYQDNNERRQREFDLLERAVVYINANYPIPSDLDIDYDNDGYVDNVCFIVRGNTAGWSELLWPHKWSLFDRTVLINGKIVNVFNFQLADATQYFNTATMCHEMNHSLSAPDLYHYYNGKDLSPVGRWDLMETHTTPPQHCGAYMKMKYGHWIDEIPEITQAGTYTLNPISSATPENIAYKITTDDPNQFYVLEYRDKSVETALYGSGLLIYRIDTRFDGNVDYNPDEGIYDEIYLYRPDGTTNNNGTIKTAFFSNASGRTEFSATTNPQAFFTNGTLNNSLRIYDITSAGNTISFTYGSMASCQPPTNLSGVAQGRNAILNWEAADNAQSYKIYRDGMLIGTTESTTYSDSNLSYGSYNYYLKSVDTDNLTSTATEMVIVTIHPLVSDLTVEDSDNNAVLSWTEPEWSQPTAPIATLSYGEKNLHWIWDYTYYAHRYLADDLAQYANKAIYKVSTYVQCPGTYSAYVYTNSTSDGLPDPEALAMSQEGRSVSESGWFEFTSDEPIPISGETDLWVVFKQENTGQEYPTPSFDLSEHNANAFYASTTSPTNLYDANTNYNCAWFIKAYVSDEFYTYNLYDGTTSVATNLSGTTYTVNNIADNAAHLYTLRTNFSGSETSPSNLAGLSLGTATLSTLELGTNDQMTLTENSTLTVTGTLSNDNAENLILENGAQLIHNSTGVKATVKKVINPTNGNNQGWNFIASPVVESIEPSQNNGLLSGIYDLYLYEEPTYMWRNYKEHIVDNINQNTASGFHLNYKQGYLYANSTSDTLQFSGTLAPSDSTVSINNLSHSASILTGFNLVGNPYAHNVTSYTGNNVATECYRMNENRNNIIISKIDEDKPLLPAEGFFVKAIADNASIIFNSNSRSETTQSASIQLNLISDSLTFDRLIVKREGEPLEKLSLRESGTKIFAMKGNQEIAVAIAEGNEQAVSFKAEENGIFTLRAKVEPKEWKYLHLIDNMTGADIDLLATPEYSFEARTDDYVSRFKLVFFAPEDVYDDAPFAYISNGEIRILGKNQDFKSLQIIDMTGRIVINRDVASNVSTTGLSAGVYVLRLINDNQVKTQKVLVP